MTQSRFRTVLAAGAAAVAATAVAALPASPAAAGSPVNCPGGGATCDIGLYQQISLGGDRGPTGTAQPIALPPAPCWYNKLMDPVAMANFEFTNSGFEPLPNPNTPLNQQILRRANATFSPSKGLQFHGSPQTGNWYMLTGTPGNPASVACLNSASLTTFYQFVTPGQQVPLPPVNIPAVDLADYAANHQTIPSPGVTVSPANKTYVNLPTYVWGNWAASKFTGTMNAYKTTATLGNETVTVWSYPTQLTVNATGPAKIASPCGPDGSRAPVGHPPNTPPGTLPDCGLLPSAPTNGLGISATVTWTRTWGVGDLNGPGPNTLPPATVTGPATTLPVAEIQSINNNG